MAGWTTNNGNYTLTWTTPPCGGTTTDNSIGYIAGTMGYYGYMGKCGSNNLYMFVYCSPSTNVYHMVIFTTSNGFCGAYCDLGAMSSGTTCTPFLFIVKSNANLKTCVCPSDATAGNVTLTLTPGACYSSGTGSGSGSGTGSGSGSGTGSGSGLGT